MADTQTTSQAQAIELAHLQERLAAADAAMNMREQQTAALIQANSKAEQLTALLASEQNANSQPRQMRWNGRQKQSKQRPC